MIREEPTCWSTPISNANSVLLTSLVDEGVVAITFKAQTQIGTALVCFEFSKPLSYSIDRDRSALKRHRRSLGNSLVCSASRQLTDCELIDFQAISRFMLEDDLPSNPRFIFLADDCTIIVESINKPSIRVIATQRRKSA